MRDAAREFAEKRLYPNAERFDHEERLPDDLLAELGELGYLGMSIPDEYGGMGLDPISYALVIEEFARACAGLAITVSVHNSLAAGAIKQFGNDDQKKKYLPRLAAGELGAYALTESDAGTDVGSIRLSAKSDGDHYVLN